MSDDSEIVLPKWTQQSDVNLYSFPESSMTTSRLRRIERILQYERRGSVLDAGDFTAVSSASVDSSGAIILSDVSGFVVSGAMPPYVVAGNFAYTSAGTNIHWYWDGTNSSNILVIKRADGTRLTIPSGDLNITGLNGATTYYFYPFWSTLSGCGVSFVLGTIGSPQFAFAATSTDALQTQSLIGHEALSSGAMTAVTGSSGGAGGGGAAGRCVMSGTDIEPLLPEWTYETKIFPQSQWVRLIGKNGDTVNVVPKHRFYCPDGEPREAQKFRIGDWINHRTGDILIADVYSFTRICTKWQVIMPKGHLYWANGFLSSNSKAAEL